MAGNIRVWEANGQPEAEHFWPEALIGSRAVCMQAAACAAPPQPPPGETHLRVAAYIRVSSDKAEQENSYEAQEKYFTALLQQHPTWISAGVYSDYGQSGTSREKRTGYRRLLRHCQEGRIDRVICKSISRFARNTQDFMHALAVLNENRVTILFEKENLDTQRQNSLFILTTLAAIAQEESRNISSNVRWSNQKRYPKGHTHNMALYGYRFASGENETETLEGGYQVRRVEPVAEEAAVVEHIFQAVSDGRAYAEIARELNARHIPAPGEREGIRAHGVACGWTGTTISQMLRLERYCGDVLLQKTYTPDYLSHKTVKNVGQMPQYLVRNHHPALIGRVAFQHAQAVWQSNSLRFRNKGREKRRYAFSGRLVCAHCGSHFHIRNTAHHAIWFCPTAALNNGRSVCHAERVYEVQLVQMLRRAFAERFALLAEPMADDATVADILSGQYAQEGACAWADRAKDFVAQIHEKLEALQQNDCMERDRSLLRHRMAETEDELAAQEYRIGRLDEQRRALQSGLCRAEAHRVEKALEKEKARRQEIKQAADRLSAQLSTLETYWERLEADYPERIRALKWLATLPEGHEGAAAFLNGLTSEYIRAFVLEITVQDPLNYVVHWFDDSRTAVTMATNIADDRYSGA